MTGLGYFTLAPGITFLEETKEKMEAFAIKRAIQDEVRRALYVEQLAKEQHPQSECSHPPKNH